MCVNKLHIVVTKPTHKLYIVIVMYIRILTSENVVPSLCSLFMVEERMSSSGCL